MKTKIRLLLFSPVLAIFLLLLLIVAGCLKDGFVDIGPVLIDKDLLVPDNAEPITLPPVQQDK